MSEKPEREQTDASLEAERAKTDTVVAGGDARLDPLHVEARE